VGADGTGERGQGGDGGRRGVAGLPNYRITDPELLVGGTPKVRFAKNKLAIETYQQVISEQRAPTPEERDAIAAYIGWGSFGQELFKGGWERPIPTKGWEAEDRWLRDHMGKENWQSAQQSIINAHYTDPPTVQAMWEMARAMGFTGGRVLEPSMGIGNFFGLMPADLADNSQLTGIEMDQMTGGMAKMLYPSATIRVQPYQNSQTPDNFYDLVIGNWPFAADGPVTRKYMDLAPSLHDFFFLKALDQVRPGGLVMGITSSGTMDKEGQKTRMELAKKAELVAAFRLPSGAFEKYAGTNVVTDILIFRKREKELSNAGDPGWIKKGIFTAPYELEIGVNQYWLDHPSRVLGTLNHSSNSSMGTTMGRPGMVVDRPANYAERLANLPSQVPNDAYHQKSESISTVSYVANNNEEREGAITVGKDGKLYQVYGDQLIPLENVKGLITTKALPEVRRQQAQLKALVGIRQAYGALIDAERKGAAGVESLRNELRDQYDDFVQQHGMINQSVGLKILYKKSDPFYNTLAALEIKQGQGDTATYKPATIFSKSTVRGPKGNLKNPTIRDAFMLARNESLALNLPRIAELAKKSEEEVLTDLLDSGAIFNTPAGAYEVSDIYLSGNVRSKLQEALQAQENGMKMAQNIKALTAVLPKTIPYFQIEAKLGAPWVSNAQYQAFIADLLQINAADFPNGLQVSLIGGAWKVRLAPDSLNNTDAATTIWGTTRYKFSNLLEAAMNNRSVVITDKDADGNRVVNSTETEKANEQISKIREEFSEWAWRDSERRLELEQNYNEVMNSSSNATFDGSFLEMPGMALYRGEGDLELRQHQLNAIWRGLALGRGMYGHEVGTGKTFVIAGLAIESRRYGLARKPLILAHNANSATVAKEINEMYPGAKVLYIDNLDKETKAIKLRQIANEDWDAIVMPHSLIDNITLKEETLQEMAADEIAQLEEEALLAAQEDGVYLTVADMNDPDAMKKVRSITAKELVKLRNKIINKIAKDAIKSSEEGAISFEELGVDMLLVDEVHSFKKPPLTTRMKMRGLNTGTSNRSIALRFLTDYIKRNNNNRNVHVFTGTPITNTLNEIYNQMRYVMDDYMAAAGVKDWDTWFNTFADATNDVELTATGEYEPILRLASFVNVAELRQMAGQFMDTVFADDMPEFKPRPTTTGKTLTDTLTAAETDELLNDRNETAIGRPYKKIINDLAPLSAAQTAILETLVGRARHFKEASPKERKEIMLSGGLESPVIVETDAANAGLDARLFDPNAADDPNSKVNRAIKNIVKHYQEGGNVAQAVFVERGFSDSSKKSVRDANGSVVRDAEGKAVKQKVARLNLAKDIVDKLEAAGIPRDQIAVVDGSVGKEKRKEIADAMNSGKIRVVIGSTQTLGVGVNMQRNLRAMHHLDAPWTPGELEQRNGRGHRQGNAWNTVLEYRYITEQLDGRRWQVLTIKDQFIKKFLKADNETRVIEGDATSLDEGENVNDLAETLASAAGDPRLLVKNKLSLDITKLERRERMHDLGKQDAKKRIESNEFWMNVSERSEKTYSADHAFFMAQKDQWSAKIDGAPVATRKDFDAALSDFIDQATSTPEQYKDFKTIGSVHGFKLQMKLRRESVYSGNGPKIIIEAEFKILSHEDPKSTSYQVRGSIASIEPILRNVFDKAEQARQKITEYNNNNQRLQEVSQLPFAQAETLKNKRSLLKQIEADLAENPVAAPSWLRYGAPVQSQIMVAGQPRTVEGHSWTKDGYFVVTAEGLVPYMDAKDATGIDLYEEHPFSVPVSVQMQTQKTRQDAEKASFAEVAAYKSGSISATDFLDRLSTLTVVKGLPFSSMAARLPAGQFSPDTVKAALQNAGATLEPSLPSLPTTSLSTTRPRFSRNSPMGKQRLRIW